MTVFLTSCLDLYHRDEEGNRIPHHFGNANQILDNLTKHIKNYNNFLMVASNENDYESTDMFAEKTFASFDMTLPFAHYQVLDARTMDHADELISSADFIFLCGGHVPTQNNFFNKINLKEKLQSSHAVILGSSAGSMNSADLVYCPPELECESLDPEFKKYLPGLGLTTLHVYPHFDSIKDDILDGKHVTEEIVLPDSYDVDIIAIDDGSYILHEDDKTTIYGHAYLIKDGKINQICDNDQTLDYTQQSQEKLSQ